MKVIYESLITWKSLVDNLRCNPNFYGYPRFDGVIFHQNTQGNDERTYTFARLIFIFVVQIKTHRVALALVEVMDKVLRKADKELGLYRVKSRARKNATFIPVRSIVRGALIFPIPDKEKDFFVVDTVDADMFTRIKSIYKNISV